MPTASIVSDPAVLMGKPVIAGTRISVELILERLGAGESIENLLAAHPQVSREAIAAAMRYASQCVRTCGAAQAEPRARRAWREIRGAVAHPLVGEDAQAWISRTRDESDAARMGAVGADR